MAKRTYGILEEMKSDCIIMPAGLRGAYHLTEMAGGRLLYTINTRVQDMILEEDPEQVEKINEPVDPKIVEQLQKIPEFVRAYEPDGMKPSEFITFGVTQKLLSQFMETGWAPSWRRTFPRNNRALDLILAQAACCLCTIRAEAT